MARLLSLSINARVRRRGFAPDPEYFRKDETGQPLNGAIPVRASSSARSFSRCPECLLTHSHVTEWRSCAISALEALDRTSVITIITDSTYVKNGITGWVNAWKRNGWRTSNKKPVKNVELWQRLDAAQVRHSVTWEWVKGHSGHPENERADKLARQGMEPFKTY